MKNLGNELKELRVQKGYSLKEISELTKINVKYLEDLENNNFKFLPEIYVRSFLKSYVRAIEGDEKYFLEMYDEIVYGPAQKISPEEIFESSEEMTDTDKELKREVEALRFYYLDRIPGLLNKKNLIFILFAVLMTITLILLFTERNDQQQQVISSQSNEEKIQYVDEFNSQKITNIVSEDSLLLGIKAVDSVWIQIKLDDKIVQEMYLRNGDYKKMKAKEKFYLFVGNAGGIVLYLNEKELPFVGNRGAVKRLEVDQNGVKLVQVKNEPER